MTERLEMLTLYSINRNLSVRFPVLPRTVFLRSNTCFPMEKTGEESGALEPQRVGNLIDRQVGVA